MKFRKRLRIESGLKEMDIAPLIDCLFLLLIFFMLTSNFIVMPGINVKLPKAVTSDAINANIVTIVITSEDIIYSEGKPVSLKDIEKYMRGLKVESVFIKADKDASIGAVVGVWDVCKKLGIEKIGIATTYED
ncbi:MAG: biopolymer transporter ExbD [Candidatus Omnitrophica bacterium]|nr:biopolymer transporter ExbD [Candidatus Omnitrophota bacterium]